MAKPVKSGGTTKEPQVINKSAEKSVWQYSKLIPLNPRVYILYVLDDLKGPAIKEEDTSNRRRGSSNSSTCMNVVQHPSKYKIFVLEKK